MFPYISFMGIVIPSYGLCMTTAIFLCAFLSIVRASRHGIPWEDMIVLGAISVGVALFCGSLLYIVVSYTPEQIFGFLKARDFSFITNSGLVFFGSLIGGVLGALITARLLRLNLASLEASIVPFLPLGHAIGRVGCLLAGCCHGREYEGLFAVRRILFSQGTYFPLQGIEALCNLGIMIFLLLYVRKERPAYRVLNQYLMMYAFVRFVLEFFRGDAIRGHLLFFSTSQWISLFLMVICLTHRVIVSRKKKVC